MFSVQILISELTAQSITLTIQRSVHAPNLVEAGVPFTTDHLEHTMHVTHLHYEPSFASLVKKEYKIR